MLIAQFLPLISIIFNAVLQLAKLAALICFILCCIKYLKAAGQKKAGRKILPYFPVRIFDIDDGNGLRFFYRKQDRCLQFFRRRDRILIL